MVTAAAAWSAARESERQPTRSSKRAKSWTVQSNARSRANGRSSTKLRNGVTPEPPENGCDITRDSARPPAVVSVSVRVGGEEMEEEEKRERGATWPLPPDRAIPYGVESVPCTKRERKRICVWSNCTGAPLLSRVHFHRFQMGDKPTTSTMSGAGGMKALGGSIVFLLGVSICIHGVHPYYCMDVWIDGCVHVFSSVAGLQPNMEILVFISVAHCQSSFFFLSSPSWRLSFPSFSFFSVLCLCVFVRP